MEKKAEEIKKKKPKKAEETKKKPDDKEQIKELTDSLQRLQAEFENYKKRIDNEKQEFLKFAKAELLKKLLPVLDSFELALNNHENPEKFLKGVEMIFAQLYSLLEAEGLRPIKSKNQKFDPFKHEVLMSEETDKEEDVVLEEFQKGYMLNDKVLRHSKVKISKKKEEKKEEEKPKEEKKTEKTEEKEENKHN